MIRRISALLICVSLLCLIQTKAEALTISAYNEARYARRTLNIVGNQIFRNYFENAFTLDATQDNFHFHVRQRHLLPSEFDVRRTGLDAIDQRYVDYDADPLKIRAGNFYRTWGQGLMFGTVELLELDFDNGLDGFLAEGEWGNLEAAIFRGVETDSAGIFLEAGEGFWTSYRLPRYLRVGASVMSLDMGLRHDAIDRRGYEAELSWRNISWLTVYTYDHFVRETFAYPHGLYSSLSTYGRGWGVIVDYKNYALQTYDYLTLNGVNVGQPFLQFPPTVRPETTMPLMDRDRRAQHFDNEVGFQIETNLTNREWEARLNLVSSSQRRPKSVLPGERLDYSPYQSAYLSLFKRTIGSYRFGIQGMISKDIEFPNGIEFGGQEARRVATGLTGYQRFDRVWSVAADFELMWTDVFILYPLDNARYPIPEVPDQYLALTVSRAPVFSFTGLLERSIEMGGESGGIVRYGHRFWPSGEVTMYFNHKHKLAIFVGHERGGVRCSGGACRYVDPLKGVKVTLTSQL